MNTTKESTEIVSKLYEELGKVIIGRKKEIKLLLTALLAKGHVLLEDLPGMGKTTLVKAFAKVLDCYYSRVQCTPDLLPSDVTGVSIFNPQKQDFEFRKGPIFTNILLVDEINRALPRTQSSLLEGMEERQVSVEGKSIGLSLPFMVLATQNPIELEGTFPLPEAQMDRFFMKISMGYPTLEEEEAILEKVGDDIPFSQLSTVCSIEIILQLQKQVELVHVHGGIRKYIVALANETRNHPKLAMGVSPRASKALYKAVKVWALLEGRDYVLPDDVKALLVYLWSHRVVLNSEGAITGLKGESIIEEVLSKVPLPKEIVGKTA